MVLFPLGVDIGSMATQCASTPALRWQTLFALHSRPVIASILVHVLSCPSRRGSGSVDVYAASTLLLEMSLWVRVRWSCADGVKERLRCEAKERAYC